MKKTIIFGLVLVGILVLSGCAQSKSNVKLLTENNIQILSSEWSTQANGFNNPKVTFSVNSGEKFVSLSCYLDTTDNINKGKYPGKEHQGATFVEDPGTYVTYGATVTANQGYQLDLCCSTANSERESAFCKPAGTINGN